MSDQPAANLEELLSAANLLENAQQIEESLYQLQWGSALVVVGVKGRALVIISPMFKGLPEGREGDFCHRLLGLNSALGGVASFAIQPDGWVVLQGGRDVKGMDPEEFTLLITTVAERADHYDNLLLDEFYAPEAMAASADADDDADDGEVVDAEVVDAEVVDSEAGDGQVGDE